MIFIARVRELDARPVDPSVDRSGPEAEERRGTSSKKEAGRGE
jgi:hypothetical protein